MQIQSTLKTHFIYIEYCPIQDMTLNSSKKKQFCQDRAEKILTIALGETVQNRPLLQVKYYKTH